MKFNESIVLGSGFPGLLNGSFQKGEEEDEWLS
jgi:hypothetical protein